MIYERWGAKSRGIMINDVIGDVRTRILRHFPERQIYLRSGGEVKYYVLSPRLQMAVVTGLTLMAAWCFLTILNLLVGNNPFQTSAQALKENKLQYERLLADSRAKEANAQLMLDEQRESFETMARSLEQKHQTLSQIMGSSTSIAGIDAADMTYAQPHVLMAPVSRDTNPRQSRHDVIQTASLTTGLALDSSLNNIGETQDTLLISAESETLERIERNRALIQSTEMDVDTVLSEAGYGKGGPVLPLDATPDESGFISRVSAIQARVAEVAVLDEAVKALPLGHPVGDETYQTSSFGIRKDPFTKRPSFHPGIDFGGRKLTAIVATADGVVTYVGRRGAYGRVVEIDHGHGFKTRYAHLNKTFVKRGQTVEKGFKVGGMGSTGRSTATHLHYEVHFQGRVYDPSKFLKAGLYVQ
jgi:hypothetical protein